MKIVMLSGKTNCGKSTTLNLVYDYIHQKEGDIIEAKMVLGNPKYRDFECIIQYRDKTIAFYTMGDYSYCLLDAFEKYYTKCDYLICACNTRFVKPYKRICDFEHIIIDKSIAISLTQADCGVANSLDKEKIMKEIE